MNLLEAMRYLAALEQHRHFGRAAQACHITQPALSNAVRALEAEFGVTIVRRGRQYEGLTPEGARVLETAHRMLHERETLNQELRGRENEPLGRLAIGSVPTATPIASRFAARLQARHRGIVPAVRSLSSAEIESGIENLSLDIAFGYGDRVARPNARVEVVAQYVEHYFVLRRAADAGGAGHRAGAAAESGASGRRIGAPIGWRAAADLPLCMLTPEMHNRRIVDASFASAGAEVQAAIETNSVLTLVLAVLDGEVCSVLPGALVAIAMQYPGLEALPLVDPHVVTPIGLMTASGGRLSLAQQAALRLAGDADWLAHAAAQSGPLGRGPP